MILFIAFAFLAGIVTILSPCILPILPIILTSSVGDRTGKGRPFGVVLGFILSFTLFTLFLSTIVRLTGIPASSLRVLSIVIIAMFGISLLVPKFQLFIEKGFTSLAKFMPNNKGRKGFSGGLIIGFSIGLLWTPCVGPILASVISLAITGTVTLQTLLITLSYSLGTAIPMFLIILGGQNALKRIPWLLSNLSKIQKGFGILMILTAIAIFFNLDRRFQSYILDTFPNYGTGLTQIEDNQLIKNEFEKNNIQKTDDIDSFTIQRGPKAPEIIAGGQWFNSDPLTLESLRGKVVLIDFWTYSCINCQRTLPYLRDWNEKYKDSGLVIIGVHTPEFEFEKDPNNVAQALKDFRLTYPVVQDNDFQTWRAYKNRYWPAKYLIDKDGYVRYTHFGEGAYDKTEKNIQDLLKENGAQITSKIDNPTYTVNTKTGETYLGYSRISNFASPERIKKDSVATYSNPKNLRNNQMAYEGNWLVTNEYANPQKGSSLYFSFDSKEVFLVMNTNGEPSKIKVYIDDKLYTLGDDNKDGMVTVDSDRLYKIIKLETSGRHILKLEFLDNNSELFAFTFG